MRIVSIRTYLAVQQLRLPTGTAGGEVLIPWSGNKDASCCQVWPKSKKQINNNNNSTYLVGLQQSQKEMKCVRRLEQFLTEWTLTYYVYHCEGLMAETGLELIRLKKIVG